jgi:uncharacterized protein (TIGR03118 family)
MHPNSFLARRLAFASLATFALAAVPAAFAAGVNAYTQANLVSDGSVQANHTDPNLVNAWGIAFNPTGYSWVANNGTGTSTLYDGNGVPQSLVVAVPNATNTGPGNPTGIVYNASSDFVVTKGAAHGPSIFMFANEDGAISGWAPAVDGTHAILAVVPGADPPNYKGLAIASNGSNHLYATDFGHARIDVYDKTFTKVNLAGSFTDPNIPAGYAPFGIQAIQNVLIVTYAKQGNDGDEMTGAGLGFVDEYDLNGNLLHRVASHTGLNAPWGIALAPSNFGKFSNALLIGNFGDGTIVGISRTGAKLGYLNDANGVKLSIQGLWGLQFGNGLLGQAKNSLFFASGPGGEAGGLYGSLTPVSP